MKIDFHVHTKYSHDAIVTLEDIEAIFNRKDRVVDAIAITDHNTVEGALELKKRFKDNIIVGEEVDTGEGELIGYWLTKGIEKGLGIDRTVEEIRRQGGKVAIPHPFDKLRSKHINSAMLDRFVKGIDMIEVFNSRNIFEKANTDARQFAETNDLLAIAGSDAHYKGEIGNAYVDCVGIESVDDPQLVCGSIREGVVIGKRSSIMYHIMTKMLKSKDLFIR